jgi:hypothetical protein
LWRLLANGCFIKEALFKTGVSHPSQLTKYRIGNCMTLIYLIDLLQLTILNERLSQGPAVLSSVDVFIHFVREFFLYFATGMDTYFYLLLPF